jgi:small subunit ribosomal protein S9
MVKEKTTKKPVKKAEPKPKAKKPVEAAPKEVEIKEVLKKAEAPATATSRYFYAVGRRKCAVAQVRVYPGGKGNIVINNKDLKVYFPPFEFQNTILSPLKLAGQDSAVDVSVKVKGGGKRGQADSIRHGIARALLLLDKDYRKSLRKAGFLTRDARVKERKKPGLKRARRAPQWAKR